MTHFHNLATCESDIGISLWPVADMYQAWRLRCAQIIQTMGLWS